MTIACSKCRPARANGSLNEYLRSTLTSRNHERLPLYITHQKETSYRRVTSTSSIRLRLFISDGLPSLFLQIQAIFSGVFLCPIALGLMQLSIVCLHGNASN